MRKIENSLSDWHELFNMDEWTEPIRRNFNGKIFWFDITSKTTPHIQSTRLTERDWGEL